MNNMKNQLKLKVYYDGLCKVCSKEIDHYKKQKGAENIDFVDICSPQFNSSDENLDPVLIHKIMHVRRLDGSLATRVDAFVEIWKTLPKYNFLARLASLKGIHVALEIFYSGFILVRPLLPRYSKNYDCSESPYCETKNI